MYLPPWLIQLFGMGIIVLAVVFWVLTGHESLLVMGAGTSLIGLGRISGLRIALHEEEEKEEAKKK